MLQGTAERLRPDVSLHLIGEQGILLDPVAQKIYRLNASAAFVWLCLEQGAGLDGIQERLQQRLRLSAQDAADYIRRAMAEWRGLGLLRPSHGNLRDHRPDRLRPANDASPGQPPRATRASVPIPKGGHAVTYRLLDSSIAIWSPSAALVHAAHAPFRHLSSEIRAQPSSVLELARVRHGYRLAADGRVLDTCPERRQIAPMLKLALTQLALERCCGSGAVHAAAVRRNGQAILLVGAAGSGKTTLAAGLMLGRSEVLADDTAVLSEDGASVRPLPMPLCIKRGAWPVLGRVVPELKSLPVHRRADGQDVRYLTPTTHAAVSGPNDAARIGAIVFPRYSPGATLDARRIEPDEAFDALLPQFYPLTNRFEGDTIDRLTRLLTGVGCIGLTYGDLREAVGAIEAFAC